MRRLIIDGKPVVLGQIVTDFRGDKAIVTGWEESQASSSGRIYVKWDEDQTMDSSYYPSVFGAKWEEELDMNITKEKTYTREEVLSAIKTEKKIYHEKILSLLLDDSESAKLAKQDAESALNALDYFAMNYEEENEE